MVTDLFNRNYVRHLLMYQTNNKYHICEMLRMIYDHVDLMTDKVEKEVITEILVDAMISAKKMQNRLSYYQKTYKDNTGNKAQDIVGLAGVKGRSRMRTERKLRDGVI